MKRILILLLSINIATICFAQGNSIPKSSKAKAQEAALPEELPDSVQYRYQLFNGLSVSANLFDPVMNLFKWDHANYEVTLTADIHHRFFPQVTVGMGYCNETSDDGLKYSSSMKPSLKVGMLYNFQYNSTKPDNFYYVVCRYGLSKSTADIENLFFTDGYWDNYGPAEIKGQDYFCHWLEIGGGIKVKIAGPFSLGWELCLKPMLSKGKCESGNPYFVPGYGTSKFGFGFHLYYDIF